MRGYADIHRALSDETRLRIVIVLGELGELCSCDIESGLEITQSRASRHLGTLRQAGIVEDRREGQWVYYRLRDPLAPIAREAVRALSREAKTSEQAQADIARARKERRSPCC